VRYDHLTQLNSELEWYPGQYDALDALVEVLRTYNGWLEYRLRAAQDALLDQHAQTMEGASAVDRVKAARLERDEALAVANGDLKKARATLAEVLNAMTEKKMTHATAQTQLQQDRAILEGAWSWQAQAEQKAKEAERLGAELQEKITFAWSGACVSRRRASSSRRSPPLRMLRPPSSASA
jgi:hypothetical protein